MIRTLFAAALVGALSFAGIAYAGDPAPAAPSLPTDKAAPVAEPAAPAAAATTEAPKAPSPIHVMMGWISKQVAPTLENPCPATADGEKAWRAWFGGGKDVPLASLRDEMVAQGFDADRFVTFFQEMVAKSSCSGGDCSEGKCSEGKCADGKCADGKCSEGKSASGKCEGAKCSESKGAEAKVGDIPAASVPTADAKPAAKSSCGGCKDKDAAKTDVPPAKPADAPVKP